MPTSDPPPNPEPQDDPLDLRQTDQSSERSETKQDDDVSLLLNDLAAEVASLRTETRSEIGHLGRLMRAEGIRISRQFSSEIADLLTMVTPDEQQRRTTLTRAHLAIAQLAGVAATIIFIKTMT